MSEWVNLKESLPCIRGNLIHVLSISKDKLKEILESLSFDVYMIDGSRIVDQGSFFAEFSQSLQFPPYFGNNWGAWDDSLGDFGDLAPNRVAIIWVDAHKTFTQDPQTFIQAVCDLYNLAASLSLRKYSGAKEEGKQFEVFLLMQ